jgi:hypothetical protein
MLTEKELDAIDARNRLMLKRWNPIRKRRRCKRPARTKGDR